MGFSDYLHWLSRALLTQRRRSLLSVTGFAIGIAMVVLMLALGEGLRRYVLAQFTQFGTHLLAVTPGKEETAGLGSILKTVRPLSLDDARALERLPVTDKVVPSVWGTARISAVTESGPRARSTDVAGVSHQALELFKLQIASGRFLPADDPDAPRNFAVLGSELSQHLFSGASPLGESVRIGSRRFRVVGVLAAKGQLLGYNMDDVIYIPARRALQLFNRDSLMEIDLLYHPWLESGPVAELVRRLLRQRHGDEDFTLVTQDQMLESLERILLVIRLAGAGLGAVSLLVSAVGVFTIQTLTVSERMAEIGLLRALGCSRRLLVMLFLGEACLLALAGGVLGCLAVWLLLLLAGWLLPALPLAASLPLMLSSVLFAGLIGAISGLRPALAAARLDPVLALRAL